MGIPGPENRLVGTEAISEGWLFIPSIVFLNADEWPHVRDPKGHLSPGPSPPFAALSHSPKERQRRAGRRRGRKEEEGSGKQPNSPSSY